MSRRDEQEIRQAIDIFERRLADHLARLVGQGNEDPLGPAGHGPSEMQGRRRRSARENERV
jgi:hypothetical protein